MGFKINRTGGMVVGAHNIGGDIPPSGTINITENGTYDVGQYASAEVNTPQPSGKITISQNGSDIDVSSYALADVDVAGDISVDEDYTVSEGTLTTASVELVGDVVAHIPEGVTKIGNNAFTENAIITNVIMPNTVTEIEDGNYMGQLVAAFGRCFELTTIRLSDNLEKIGAFSFNQCSKLESIIIPTSVTEIGNSAFANTGITNIYYEGTQAEWEQITIGTDAIPQGVTIHYDYVPQ